VVTGQDMHEAEAGTGPLVLHVDGSQPLAGDTIAAVGAVCARAEAAAGTAVVVVRVSGSPAGDWVAGLSTKLVNRWEQVLRRLERVPAMTIAAVTGDCGGPALDALLATDHRIAADGTRLLLAMQGGVVWPGMALYRLARQAPNATAVRLATLFGKAIDLDDALALHLVHEAAGDVDAAIAVASARAVTVSGAELAIRRQLTADAQNVGFEEALGTHLAAVDRTLRLAAHTVS
jgi:isomerase DpgB